MTKRWGESVIIFLKANGFNLSGSAVSKEWFRDVDALPAYFYPIVRNGNELVIITDSRLEFVTFTTLSQNVMDFRYFVL
jgi:hypothetical protein